MKDLELKAEVISAIQDYGYVASYVIPAVNIVYTPGLSYSRWFQLALAWLREDWKVLSPLYMAVCAQYLIESGYILTSISFTDNSERVGYFTVVWKEEVSYGSIIYAVRRTVRGLSMGVGLNACELLERL